ncbi:hypothetical protein C8J57DRAFT_1494136 [Mycena rebaudengoi]|nr:hypothetical protein C8J57DRAFT_1494136 [Mycena rebaudengoi]
MRSVVVGSTRGALLVSEAVANHTSCFRPPPPVPIGKLNIAHHKSYHPYRRDNIEKVRRDEEEARQQEPREEGRMLLAVRLEARIDRLRECAGTKSTSKRRKEDADLAELGDQWNPPAQSLQPSERRRRQPVETERGVPLAPSAKDLKPCSVFSLHGCSHRKRDTPHKSTHDPLTSITHQLASRQSSYSSSKSSYHPPTRRPSPPHPIRHTDYATVSAVALTAARLLDHTAMPPPTHPSWFAIPVNYDTPLHPLPSHNSPTTDRRTATYCPRLAKI